LFKISIKSFVVLGVQVKIYNFISQFINTFSNVDDIMGKLMLADSKIKYEALLNADVKISGVNVTEVTDDTFKKIYRGQQLVLFGKYETGGKARVRLKANLTGEDKTYATDFVFPDTDTDNPELERLWALAMIEKIEALERIGSMPETESENAIRDLGLAYQIVTDYTSMVVISDTAFADRGIERRNQTRIAREQQARAKKAQQPASNYTVDRQRPAFKWKVPSLGGGGGAIDPLTGGLAAVITALGAIRLMIGRKKKRNDGTMLFNVKKFRLLISRTKSHIPYVTLLLTLAAGLIHLFYGLRIQLLYDRSALIHHELWRLLTCHWVHLSWDHLFWSAMTFLGLGSLCELMDKKKYYATIGVSALLVPVAIWWAVWLAPGSDYGKIPQQVAKPLSRRQTGTPFCPAIG
jgi:hypothetical protein